MLPCLIIFFKIHFFYFVCMGVFSACELGFCGSQKKGVRSPGTRVVVHTFLFQRLRGRERERQAELCEFQARQG